MKLLKDRFEYKAGITVYPYRGCDYGLASDDTEYYGVEHISITASPGGNPPSFTVPVTEIE